MQQQQQQPLIDVTIENDDGTPATETPDVVPVVDVADSIPSTDTKDLPVMEPTMVDAGIVPLRNVNFIFKSLL